MPSHPSHLHLHLHLHHLHLHLLTLLSPSTLQGADLEPLRLLHLVGARHFDLLLPAPPPTAADGAPLPQPLRQTIDSLHDLLPDASRELCRYALQQANLNAEEAVSTLFGDERAALEAKLAKSEADAEAEARAHFAAAHAAKRARAGGAASHA